MKKPIIIYGPIGSGKSTMAKQLVQLMEFVLPETVLFSNLLTKVSAPICDVLIVEECSDDQKIKQTLEWYDRLPIPRPMRPRLILTSHHEPSILLTHELYFIETKKQWGQIRIY